MTSDGVSSVTFSSDNITQIIELQAPNKPAGTYTIATTDDIDTQGLPPGGAAGQVLTKIDATDYNATWQENFADWTSQVKHIVKNNGLSGTITKGTAVYVTSSNGTNMLVGRASNASEPTSSKTMGLMQSDITTTGGNQTGFVITEGLLQGLNTASATAGDPVWLGVNGALIYGLTNKPYAPAHLVFIGIVTKISAGNGEIWVKVQNGFELKEIHDVDLITTTPINGHLLGFDGTLWVNKTIATWLGFTPFQLPALTSGSVLFSNGTTIAQKNAQLFWDDTNNRLGIGTATPASTLQVVGGDITIDNNKGYLAKVTSGSTLPLIKFDTSNNCLIGSNFQGGATNIYATTNTLFYSYPSSVLTERMRIVGSSGNVLINTTTDAGYKLDVNGTARVSGTTTTQNIAAQTNATYDIGLLATRFRDGWFSRNLNCGTIWSNNLAIATTNLTFYNAAVSVIGTLFGSGNLLLSTGTQTDVASSKLTIESTTQGFLPPRMTTTQKNAIATPATGLMVYDNTLLNPSVYNGTNWQNVVIPNSSGNIVVTGNIDAPSISLNGTDLESLMIAYAIALG
jgi:hypothetical protein